jgi:small GTP-binding protein
MFKRILKQLQPAPESESSLPPVPPDEEAPKVPTFTEIGGSPVPGLTLRQVLRGHANQINRIAWSPDGTYLASPSSDKTIRIWDAGSGACLHTLQGHTNLIWGVAWSPDGQRLASASADQTIRLWDATSGEPLQTLKGHTGAVFSVAWSPDGQCLASASNDKTIRLWDVTSGKSLRTLEGHTDTVAEVAWSPDGQRLASASYDRTIRTWNTVNGEALQTLVGHTKWVFGVAWSPNDQHITSASGDSTIRLWEVNSGNSLKMLEGHVAQVNNVAFSHTGRWLASKGVGTDSAVRLWRCDTWACVAVLEEPTANTSFPPGIAFHPHLPLLATLGEQDTIVRIWELDEALLLGQAQASVHYTTAKLVLVGDSGVGKTGLGWRLAHDEFKEHASTHGQQFWPVSQLGLKRADGTECEAVLWDLAGQHVYRQIHSIWLENVAAALVLFDPSNRQEPLKGVQFWLEQLKGRGTLPSTVLVGARVDRGAPAISQQELDQFCQRYGIRGGYISTSAMNGEGLEALLETLKTQIPWDEMTATVTTVTFKRIKDYVLALKEQPNRQGVLVGPEELRAQLQATDPDWQFTDAEMLTAVGHLETHGYVAILRSAAGEQPILLAPELLVTLAASIVLLADKHPRELGAISETELVKGSYPFAELAGLTPAESQILLDAAILRFLQHNICFRETLGDETLLIFPGLIKQKRPLVNDLPANDDISYVVRGRVENLYASLVVLLGYTPSFTRINQWQSQAQYEMGAGEICGFRLIEDRQGELELVLYYGDRMPASGRAKFQELFEQFLYQRDVDITPYPPVVCAKGHQQKRATVIERARERKPFMFCDECGDKVMLPDFDKPQTIGLHASPWLQREEAAARLRSAYEVQLTKVKGYRRNWAVPRCYLSHLPKQAAWAAELTHDLRDAGVYVVEAAAQVQPDDFVFVLDTPAYQQAFRTPALAADAPLIRARLKEQRCLISLPLTGDVKVHELKDCTPGSFCDETHYPVSLFDLVLTVYAIPLTHAGFAPLRQALHQQWEDMPREAPAANNDQASSKAATKIGQGAAAVSEAYIDFDLHIAPNGHAIASSPEGQATAEISTQLPDTIRLALSLIEKRATDANLLKHVGQQLYGWLLPGDIHTHFHQTEAIARREKAKLRLRLRIEAESIASLPLELLYRRQGGYFLAANPNTVLSRYLNLPLPPERVRRHHGPLHMLAIIAAPTDQALLNPDEQARLDPDEWEAIITGALAGPLANRQMTLQTVKHATRKEIRNALLQHKPNIIQFVGHGLYSNGKGYLMLVDENTGETAVVDDERFAGLFMGHDDNLGLISLATCASGKSDNPQGFVGIAPQLVQRGVPAVLCMQYDVLVQTARIFLEDFYAAVAARKPIDWATQSARNAVSQELGLDNREFATPVLYMRAKDGDVF